MDYSILLSDGRQFFAQTLREAQAIAKKYAKLEPFIDQYKDEELTNTHWTLENNKFTKHGVK
jgi:hypothetical protein